MIRGAVASVLGSLATGYGVKTAADSFESWDRTSYSGATVSLTEGLVASVGMTT